MPETINVVENKAPQILLFEAMVATCNKNDILTHFNIPPRSHGDVNVQVLVNGIEVPFLASVSAAWDQMMSKYNQSVIERAKELIAGSRLNELEQLLSNFEWQLGEELNRLFPNHKKG